MKNQFSLNMVERILFSGIHGRRISKAFKKKKTIRIAQIFKIQYLTPLYQNQLTFFKFLYPPINMLNVSSLPQDAFRFDSYKMKLVD